MWFACGCFYAVGNNEKRRAWGGLRSRSSAAGVILAETTAEGRGSAGLVLGLWEQRDKWQKADVMEQGAVLPQAHCDFVWCVGKLSFNMSVLMHHKTLSLKHQAFHLTDIIWGGG